MTSIRFLLLVGTALATSSGAAFAQTPAAPVPTQTPAPAATPPADAPQDEAGDEAPAEEAAKLDEVVVTALTGENWTT
jgi:hypothetical protein